MRSIRRTMSIYLSALLVVTLLTVGLVIDRVTENALSAREADGVALIQAQYEERCREEKDKTEQSLFNQANLLYGLMSEHNELASYRLWTEMTHAMFSLNPLTNSAWTATAGYSPTSEVLARGYFANLPLPEEYLFRISEVSQGTDYQQLNAGRGSEWHSKSLAGRKLPFDPKEIDAKLAERGHAGNLMDWVYDYTTLTTDSEVVYRILLKVPRTRRGIPGNFGGGGGGGVAPRSLLGTWSSWAIAGFPYPPPTSLTVNRPDRLPPAPIDNIPRLYIQCARPRAAIEATLAQFADERDDKMAKLGTDVAHARNAMRLQTLVVGLIALLAAAIGGPIVVGVGLRPVGKLSDAVSRVSEKDFKLPHDGRNLVQELVPIHGRLTQTLDMLQRAFTREKQAVADISHELKTPITALMATIDVALRKQRTPEEYREKLQECRDISKQLSQLVERIMTLASLDSGNDRTIISRCDAIELCAGCTSLIRTLAAENGVTVRLHLPDDMIELETDAGKLREVLNNLLHNAIEYNRPEGTIDLTLQRVGSNAVFVVRDSGIGMTPEIEEKIFERFFRADPSRHATGVHAGLGLAIVKEYVTRLKGMIEVESEHGKGSTFRVTIPALPFDAIPPVPSEEPVAAGT